MPAWPGLSHWFGIHPWDVTQFSPAELLGMVEALDELEQSAREGR